jgi:hypothetical protein
MKISKKYCMTSCHKKSICVIFLIQSIIPSSFKWNNKESKGIEPCTTQMKTPCAETDQVNGPHSLPSVKVSSSELLKIRRFSPKGKVSCLYKLDLC